MYIYNIYIYIYIYVYIYIYIYIGEGDLTARVSLSNNLGSPFPSPVIYLYFDTL